MKNAEKIKRKAIKRQEKTRKATRDEKDAITILSFNR